jgi:hypothetical protein
MFLGSRPRPPTPIPHLLEGGSQVDHVTLFLAARLEATKCVLVGARQGDRETRRQGDKETDGKEKQSADSVSLSPCLDPSGCCSGKVECGSIVVSRNNDE